VNGTAGMIAVTAATPVIIIVAIVVTISHELSISNINIKPRP